VEDGTTLLADEGLDWEVELADTVTVNVCAGRLELSVRYAGSRDRI